jgi:PII-like signaling protein
LLYEHVVSQAKKQGITGTAVYRGIKGFGKNSILDWLCFWKPVEKCPVIIEVIDKTEILEKFFKTIETDLRQMPNGCLVTITPIEINQKNRK